MSILTARPLDVLESLFVLDIYKYIYVTWDGRLKSRPATTFKNIEAEK